MGADESMPVPRRARRRVAVVAGGLVAVLALGYLWVCLGYRLEYGHMTDVGSGAVIDPGPTRVARHELRVGSKVLIAITVRNPGRYPVEFDGVSIDSRDIAIDEVTMGLANAKGECCLPEHAKPFRRATLRPDDEVILWLNLRVTGANSYLPCSGFTLATFEVRFHVLGLTRSHRLEFMVPIEFRQGGC